jgi:hypothetical protein
LVAGWGQPDSCSSWSAAGAAPRAEPSLPQVRDSNCNIVWTSNVTGTTAAPVVRSVSRKPPKARTSSGSRQLPPPASAQALLPQPAHQPPTRTPPGSRQPQAAADLHSAQPPAREVELPTGFVPRPLAAVQGNQDQLPTGFGQGSLAQLPKGFGQQAPTPAALSPSSSAAATKTPCPFGHPPRAQGLLCGGITLCGVDAPCRCCDAALACTRITPYTHVCALV